MPSTSKIKAIAQRIFYFLLLFALIEAKKRRRRPKSLGKSRRPNDGSQHISVVKRTYLAVIIPVVLYALYVILRDPALPEVLRNLWDGFMSKLNSYLGQSPEEIESKGRSKKTR
mmetsp:Transcript_31951/g.42175  ORF Transcript_31951/g.42175 Transcript_31951/m.42175 type:complete len:114 (-) Transcript_31951:80-421(-)